jgi:Mce-associated membrane protein
MEGDAGTRQLNPTDAQDAPDDSVAVSEQEQTGPDDSADERSREEHEPGTEVAAEVVEEIPEDAADRRPPRLGRGWLTGICACLLVLAAAAVAGGVYLVRDHRHIDAIARDNAAALAAAKDCVAATQAPDTAAMSQAQLKIMECSTGAFGAQASLYSGVLVEAYQAANAQVEVTDMEAAVERHNDDGSIDVLVALRVKLTNTEVQQQETGYRLRVQMAQDEGTYKIARLDQVTT